MGIEQFANDATTTVSSGGTTAPAAGTVQTWTVASSASFPGASSTAGTTFHVADPAAPTEKILVTNVSGTTWTVTRGSEGSGPLAHASGFTVRQVVTAGWLGNVSVVIPPSGDATGATDTANIQNALSFGLPVQLAAGTYYTNGMTVPYNGQLAGAGASLTTLNVVGNVTGISMHNPSSPAGNTYWQPVGGTVQGMTIDGTSAGTSAQGISIGDAWGLTTRDLRVQNFTGASAVGFNVCNLYTWTEKCSFSGTVANCTTLIVVDGNPPGAGVNGAPSFEYNAFDFAVYAEVGQQGVLIKNGAYLSGGDFRLVGNFAASSSPQTSSVMLITGANGAIHAHFDRGAMIRIRVEIAGAATYGPYTLMFGNTSNFINDSYGSLVFHNPGTQWQASTAVAANIQFGGVVIETTLQSVNTKPTGWL